MNLFSRFPIVVLACLASCFAPNAMGQNARGTFASTSLIKGVITDAQNGAPLEFCKVAVQHNGATLGGAYSDFDGRYVIKIEEAWREYETRDLEVTQVGFPTHKVTAIATNRTTDVMVELKQLEIIGCDFGIRCDRWRLDEPGKTTLTRDELKRMPR